MSILTASIRKNPAPVASRWLHIAVTMLSLIFPGGVSLAADMTADDLESAVIEHVQNKIGTHHALFSSANGNTSKASGNDTIKIRVIGVPGAPFHFPEQKAIKLSLESNAWDNNWSSRGIVRVRMSDDTGRSRDVGVPVQVNVIKNVWVVKSPISANSPLRANELALETRDVSQQYDYVIGEERDLNTYISRVNLIPGELLDARKLIVPPDVKYNDQITIQMSNANGMNLSVPGIALSDGKIGQTIRVRQAMFQRKYYTGKIVDKNQVQVEL